jgi:hypothetical protein
MSISNLNNTDQNLLKANTLQVNTLAVDTLDPISVDVTGYLKVGTISTTNVTRMYTPDTFNPSSISIINPTITTALDLTGAQCLSASWFRISNFVFLTGTIAVNGTGTNFISPYAGLAITNVPYANDLLITAVCGSATLAPGATQANAITGISYNFQATNVPQGTIQIDIAKCNTNTPVTVSATVHYVNFQIVYQLQ